MVLRSIEFNSVKCIPVWIDISFKYLICARTEKIFQMGCYHQILQSKQRIGVETGGGGLAYKKLKCKKIN